MTTRVAKLMLSLGAVSVTLVAFHWKVFELDRYFVPKELVLHIVGLAVAIILVTERRTLRPDAADMLLALFLAISGVSALFATNHWLAQRALAVSVSSALVFWGARRIGASGSHTLLLWTAAGATVLAAITSLLQAYGVDSEWFTLNRAPGGTLGNRNFVAHLIAIGLPAVVWCTLTARKPVLALAGSIALGLMSAALVLSRSRAAWLAVVATLIVGGALLFIGRRYYDRGLIGGRLARLALTAFIGGALAVVLPNNLDWKSESPYLDSARNIIDYNQGSGRGRLAQYTNSLRMAKADPVLGAGPGNWPVRYVRYAPASDKSLLANGMTANPWPSSDWVAFLTERGFAAGLALLGVFAVLFFGSLRRWRDLPDGAAVIAKITLASTIAATLVVSLFDAVLLLPTTALIAWLVIGATTGLRKSGREVSLTPRAWRTLAIAVILFSALSVVRSTAQSMAMSAVGKGGRMDGWIAGAKWDPGSYRINLRAAELHANRRQCTKARPYARQASDLFPYAAQPKRILRRCGG